MSPACAFAPDAPEACRPGARAQVNLFNVISAVIAIVALCGYANARFVRLPDSIGITAVALLISLAAVALSAANPTVAHWSHAIASQVDFPTLVFHGLLGLLLFAGSLHVSFSALARSRWTILALATIGVVLSTEVISSSVWSPVTTEPADAPLAGSART